MSDEIQKAYKSIEEERRRGKPRTEEERKARHEELYSEEAPKERGARFEKGTACDVCGEARPDWDRGWHVSEFIWRKVVPPDLQDATICPRCFLRLLCDSDLPIENLYSTAEAPHPYSLIPNIKHIVCIIIT